MADVLIVDDEKNMRRSLSIALEEWGYETSEASCGKEALDLITHEVYDILLTDLVMEEMDGIELLQKVKELSPSTEVILMSAHGTISRAVEAMQLGAYNFIVKPFSMDHLQVILQKALKQMELKQTVRHLQAVLADHYLYHDIVAVSPSMRDVMQQVVIFADRAVPILIQGESGVGKELVAMAIHYLGGRREGPFVPVNCGAFPDALLDSELFGHCKGAFTGATMIKRGLIEEANGGTLLLDEIGEAPPAFQVRLLRFLDNGLFRRIGEVVERKSDVRVIAATNRDLRKDIQNGKFREDLFYRLSV
ncbi:sigma-54 dependent transcriptional regulator, partial [bacterium]|nr:sigma-54 dependent transcriptional regulator [bacterium]